MRTLAIRSSGKAVSGFTLIEMAIVITITGLLLAGAASAYTMYIKDKRIQQTSTRTSAVVGALGDFRNLFGRYPCPASLTETRDDPGYGRESCGAAPTAAGTCSNGICTESSIRSITYLSGGTSVTGNPLVNSGFVPFRALNLPEEYGYDGFGGRLRYAVTEHMTDSSNFEAETGGIDIINASNDSILNPAGSAHFVLISHGEDQSGAYTNAGVKIPCTAGQTETDNCDETKANAVFRLSHMATGNNASRFDDTVLYFIKNDIPLWQVSEVNNNNIHQKPPGNVAFYFSSANNINTEAQSAGAVRAQDSIMTNNVCASDGTNCFPSSLIAGPLNADPTDYSDDIKCPPGEFMARIENKGAVCQAEIWLKCPDDKALTGFEADGTPICESASACQPQTIGICGLTKNLPAGDELDEVSFTAGNSAQQTYLCKDKAWTLTLNQTAASDCKCTPKTQNSKSCGTGFTGVYKKQRKFMCPEGEWGDWEPLPGENFSAQCTCVEVTQTRDGTCPANYTGTVKETRKHICKGSGSSTWSKWVEDPSTNTCRCEDKRAERTLDCPDGLTGKYKQERFLTCPKATWSAWKDVSGQGQANNCKCVSTTQERKKNCPAGKVGQYWEIRTLQCPSASWTAWKEDPSRSAAANCKPPPVEYCHWKAVSSAQPDQSFAMGSVSPGDVCECGSSPTSCHEGRSGSYTNYVSCSCQ